MKQTDDSVEESRLTKRRTRVGCNETIRIGVCPPVAGVRRERVFENFDKTDEILYRCDKAMAPLLVHRLPPPHTLVAHYYRHPVARSPL